MKVTKYKSDIISVGTLTMGGDLPVRVQSMTNTDTLDTAASVSQCIDKALIGRIECRMFNKLNNTDLDLFIFCT